MVVKAQKKNLLLDAPLELDEDNEEEDDEQDQESEDNLAI